MGKQLTAQDAAQSLTVHVAAKGADLCAKYGPRIGWGELERLLQDRAFVRYPCELRFEGGPLESGEFAYPEPNGSVPEDGFTMFVHPVYMLHLDKVPYLVLYQLVAVNYGEFASAEDAEVFGAAALGLSREEYYSALCELADLLAADGAASDVQSSCGHCGCS